MSVVFDKARGKYRASWYDSAGNRRRRWFRTKGEAEQAHALAKLSNPKARNKPRPSSIVFSTFAADFLARREPKLSGATLRNYAFAVKITEKSLGPLPLSMIDRPTFRAAVAKLRAEGRQPSTVKTIRKAHRTILRDALSDGLITADPTAEPRRQGRKPEGRDEEVPALTEEQARALLAAAREAGATKHAAIATVLLAGLRLGELLALKPSDLNRKKRILEVRRSLIRDDGIKATKTRPGLATYPVASPRRRAVGPSGRVGLVDRGATERRRSRERPPSAAWAARPKRWQAGGH